eukprot:PITA_08366
MAKVAKLLREYQDMFPTNFSNLKGIIAYLGVMKITLRLDAKPVKQRSYSLNPKCKEKVRLELDKMLAVSIIEPVEESDWGHVVCKQGLMVDLAKIVVIVNLEAPRSVKKLRTMLGHTRYYKKFIKAYAWITAPMEKLLKKDATLYLDEECQRSLDVLKEKMVIMLMLVFLDWKKEFHVHVFS